MNSDDIIKRDWIINTLARDVRNIFKAEQLIAQRNIYVSGESLTAKKGKTASINRRTGRLMASLESPDYTIAGNGRDFTVTSNIVLYMRFLDMKKHGNKQIYNKQVWGILYKNAFPQIKYNIRANVRDAVGEALERVFADNSK